MFKPVAPTVPADSTVPEHVSMWEDYYAAVDAWIDSNKACMDRNW